MLLAITLLLCILSVVLLIASDKKMRSGGTPYLINVKGRRLLPLMSLALFSLILLIGAAALKITDISITDYSAWQDENQTRMTMTVDKTYPTNGAVRIGIREGGISGDRFKTDERVQLEYPLTRLSADTDGSRSACRIAVIGDSFVWGESLVNQNSVMYRQLDYELTRRGYDCSVFGIGVGGASTQDEYVWLAETTLLEDLRPDIILIGYVRNDPELQSRQDAYNGTSNVSFVKNLLSLPANAINGFCPDVGYLLSNRLHSSEYMALNLAYVSEDNLSAYEDEVVKPLSDLISEKDLETAFVVFPRITEKAYNNRFYPPVKELYDRYGIPFYDCTAEYTEFFSTGPHAENANVNPVDLHPGTASNQFFAIYMADILENDYSYLLGEKKTVSSGSYNVSVNDWLPLKLDLTEETVSPELGVFSFFYPSQGSSGDFLYLPVKKNHVAVSFAFPVDIDSIKLEGEGLEAAEIWCNSINEDLGYDDMAYAHLGQKQGDTCVWTDGTDGRVTTLFIHAETNIGTELPLKLTVTCGDGGVHP